MTIQGTPATGRYAEAGVDIDAGADLVGRIAPVAKATGRAGSIGGLGGFGGLFDLAACGFRDPLLVATTDGVGTKVLLAVEAGAHHAIGIDLVAMCVNDLVVQGAQPLTFSTITPPAAWCRPLPGKWWPGSAMAASWPAAR